MTLFNGARSCDIICDRNRVSLEAGPEPKVKAKSKASESQQKLPPCPTVNRPLKSADNK